MKMLPGDEVRQIMWRFADRFDLQMAVAGARNVARGLVAKLVVRVLAVEDDVEQQVDGPRQVLLEYGGIEDGVFLVGEGVEVATHRLQTVQYLQG